MPKINVEFDTETKQTSCSIDGMAMKNMKNCAFYYDSYSDKYCMEMYMDQSIGDDMQMTQIIRSSLENKPVKDHIAAFLEQRLK